LCCKRRPSLVGRLATALG